MIQEELRLRRARGEEISAIPARKPEALAELRAAHAANSDIPDVTIPPTTATDPQRNNPQSDPTAAPVAYDASLVGRRVLATFTDEDVDDAPQWYPATLVMYRPKATSYNFLMHFETAGRALWASQTRVCGCCARRSNTVHVNVACLYLTWVSSLGQVAEFLRVRGEASKISMFSDFKSSH